jgi:hypothetical protein
VEDLKQDSLEQMRAHVDHCFREVSLLREELRASTNSRRGLPGIQGPAGVGIPGKDAVLKLVQVDGKIQVIDVDGKVAAELVAVPGPKGDSIVGPKGDSITGAPGKDGRNAPTLDEIVPAVVAAVKARL